MEGAEVAEDVGKIFAQFKSATGLRPFVLTVLPFLVRLLTSA